MYIFSQTVYAPNFVIVKDYYALSGVKFDLFSGKNFPEKQ